MTRVEPVTSDLVDAPAECGICGDYTVGGIEVHESCLELISRLASESTPLAVGRVWDTDLTAAELKRLANAIAEADYHNWTSVELAGRIAGTVRAIAARRLSGATS